MGRMFGKHIPDEYVSDWSSDKYAGQEEWWHWYMCGHEDGYNEAKFWEQGINDEKLRRENQRLGGIIASLSKSKQDLIEEREYVQKFYEEHTNIS